VGEHKFNPRAIAKANGAPIPTGLPNELLGSKIDAHKVPKPHVHVVPKSAVVEQDGKRYLTGEAGALVEVPDGQVLHFAEDPIPDSLLDVLFCLVGLYAEPSVFDPAGKVRGAGITVLELLRVDYAEYKKRGKALLANTPNVPGFNEVPGEWANPAASS